ncbi:hypothetical protein SD71_06660 [Cohnella kolymensis]|uniref:Dynamin N-terminal domain-containing protein n=1 Tax=Cohnella kolymensis TaxID=1590652 RepID=A0ABR5A7N3_9BACL|nr:dynamin family protein [Cohnella kolymensis]KIL36678.1 hypothetical protein SD71_06660 [Cohnella kolymensis]
MNPLKPLAEELLELSRQIRQRDAERLTSAALHGMQRDTFHVVILGEFNRGKTTFVNSLIGRPILHADMLPATAVLHLIEYGEKERIEVVYHDGRVSVHPIASDVLAGFSAGGAAPADTVRLIRLVLSHPLLQEGIVLIDTPGVNDLNESRAELTYRILPECDAAVFLLDAAAPLTRSEAEFLTGKVFHHKLDEMLFVLSKSDRLDEEELEEALEGAAGRLRQVMGRQSGVYPYSSKQVLDRSPEGLAQLDAINGLLMELKQASRRSAAARHAGRLSLAAAYIRQDLDVIRSIHRMNDEQLERFRERIKQLRLQLENRYQRLLVSIDTVGRDTLQSMLDKSYAKLVETLHSELDFQTRSHKGSMETYIETDFPLLVERMMKQYCEAKAVEIQAFLDRFRQHVTEEYTKHFSTPLTLALQESGIALPSWKAGSSSLAETGQMNEMIKQTIPVTAGALVGILFCRGSVR